MGRDRSRSRDRRRGRSNSRDKRKARSRSRERDRNSSRERRRAKSRSRDRDRRKEKRHRSRDCSREDKHERRSEDAGTGKRERSTPDKGPDTEEARKKARLEKLAAWKRQQEQQKQAVFDVPAADASASKEEAMKVWMPWEEADAVDDPVPASKEENAKVWMPWEESETAYAAQASSAIPVVPQEILAKKAKAAAKLYEEKAAELAAKDAEDPLDAFMAQEILPEVKQKEQEEAAHKEEERKLLAQQLAEGKKLPKLTDILESDDEPEPDVVLEVPLKKVKLVVGPGGEKIKVIERKSKARLQILKEEDELNRAFGSGPVVPKHKLPTKNGEAEPQMTKIMIFGNANQCEVAQRMIQEAIENKEQKQKQREKEYERKRDQKARDRQMYYMRHTHDYETLELPVGASRADVKAAYRKLAKVWHPDKHPDNKEEATERFQKIAKAYDSLMLTEEDARIEALAQK